MEREKVSITWLGQMGLMVKLGAATLLIDYFATDDPGRQTPVPIPADRITGVDCFLGTHDHLDHIDHAAWKIWAKSCPDARFLFPSTHTHTVSEDGIPIDRQRPIDAGKHVTLGSVVIHAIPAAHEFLERDEYGRYPCLQYIIEGEGVRIYHAGDTLRYEGMLPLLKAFGPMDVALLPINGRDGERYRRNCIGNMTFQEAADLAGALKPGLVIPGHWDMFADNTGDPAAFADYLEAKYRMKCRIPKILEEVEIACCREE